MLSELLRASRHLFFWIPTALVIVDLLFFILVPIVFLYITRDKGMPLSGAMAVLNEVNEFTGLEEPIFVFALVFSAAIIRVALTYLGKLGFSLSISRLYVDISSLMANDFFIAAQQHKVPEGSHVRKVFNAEVSNLVFGIFVSAAFIIPEVFVLLSGALYLASEAGGGVLLIGMGVIFSLAILLFLLRNQGLTVGKNRTESERQRLGLVETLISGAFSILLNRGSVWFLNRFSNVTGRFAKALADQVLLPSLTRSIVDGVLVLGLIIALITVGSSFESTEIAILIGLAIRAIPSLSRISSYTETIRINSVGGRDAVLLSSALKTLPEQQFGHPGVLEFVKGINGPGVYLVRGASGIGKTCAVREAISLLSNNFEISFLGQSGFIPDASLDDYLSLVGVDDKKPVIKKLEQAGLPVSEAGKLSGGQARLLQFIALTTKKTAWVVLDEPSVGLDKGLKQFMGSEIISRSSEASIIVITHDQEFVDLLSTAPNVREFYAT